MHSHEYLVDVTTLQGHIEILSILDFVLFYYQLNSFPK